MYAVIVSLPSQMDTFSENALQLQRARTYESLVETRTQLLGADAILTSLMAVWTCAYCIIV